MDRLRELWDLVWLAPRWVKIVVPMAVALLIVGAAAGAGKLERGGSSNDEPSGGAIADGPQAERGARAEQKRSRNERQQDRGRERRREQKREARRELVARDRATPARRLVADETLDRLREAACPARYGGASSESPRASKLEQDARRGRFRVIEGHKPRLVAPVNWHIDPFDSVKFQGKLQNMSWLDSLFRAYQRGDLGALRQARGLVLDWIRNNRRRVRRLPKKAWGDKVSGDRAPRIAYLARAATCEGMLKPEQGRQLLASVERHARFLSDPINHAPSNHGLFVDLGLTRLARQLPFMPNASAWKQLGAKRFERTLRRRLVEKEGLWLEHSANYQLVAIGLLRDFLGASRGEGDPPQLFTRMKRVAGWLTMPDDELVLLGDTHQRPVGEAVLNRAGKAEGLLWLPRSGLAVVRRQEPAAYLSTAATFFSGVHKHSDELTFDLYDRGHRIVSDSGTYAKDPGRWRDFSRSAEAHSVLTVDGQSYTREREAAYGSGLTAAGSGAGWFAIQGTNPLLLRAGVRHRRTILYRPGFALVVIDEARSDRRHVYRRFFQLGGEITAKPRKTAVRLEAKRFVGELHSDASVAEKRQLVRADGDGPAGYLFPNFRERVPRSTVIYRSVGKDVDHVATFGLHQREPARAELIGASARRARIGVSVEGAPRYQLIVERDGKRLSVSRRPANR